MHPPNLRDSVIVIVGLTPNSCSRCSYFKDGTCLRFEESVETKQVCDDFEAVI